MGMQYRTEESDSRFSLVSRVILLKPGWLNGCATRGRATPKCRRNETSRCERTRERLVRRRKAHRIIRHSINAHRERSDTERWTTSCTMSREGSALSEEGLVDEIFPDIEGARRVYSMKYVESSHKSTLVFRSYVDFNSLRTEMIERLSARALLYSAFRHYRQINSPSNVPTVAAAAAGAYTNRWKENEYRRRVRSTEIARRKKKLTNKRWTVRRWHVHRRPSARVTGEKEMKFFARYSDVGDMMVRWSREFHFPPRDLFGLCVSRRTLRVHRARKKRRAAQTTVKSDICILRYLFRTSLAYVRIVWTVGCTSGNSRRIYTI